MRFKSLTLVPYPSLQSCKRMSHGIGASYLGTEPNRDHYVPRLWFLMMMFSLWLAFNLYLRWNHNFKVRQRVWLGKIRLIVEHFWTFCRNWKHSFRSSRDSNFSNVLIFEYIRWFNYYEDVDKYYGNNLIRMSLIKGIKINIMWNDLFARSFGTY